MKVPTNGDSDDDEPAGEAKLTAEQSQESQDWLKEFELMKKAMQKKKETPKKEKIVEATRRKNVFEEEVILLCESTFKYRLSFFFCRGSLNLWSVMNF